MTSIEKQMKEHSKRVKEKKKWVKTIDLNKQLDMMEEKYNHAKPDTWTFDDQETLRIMVLEEGRRERIAKQKILDEFWGGTV